MGETATRTNEGTEKVYPSSKPFGYTTFFTGAGDNGAAIGEGSRLLFSLASTDASQVVDITFNEDVRVKDGYIIAEGAPFGSYLDIEVVHPQAGVVGSFGRKIPILGSGWFPLPTSDHAGLTSDLSLRITVYNSSGTAPEDPPAAFKVAGRIELFRINTI